MSTQDRRRFLEKLLLFGSGFSGLMLLHGCTYEYATLKPICEEGPVLTLLPPDTGLTIYGGDEHLIRWIAACVEFVRIDFSRNKGIEWVSIADQVRAAEGQYSWEVPQIASELALFRLVDTSSNRVLAISDAPMVLIPKILLNIKDHPELGVIGGVLELDRPTFNPLSIIRTGQNTFKVLNLNCTHNGCPVDRASNGETWLCPCHGSEFSKLGCVLQGPAQRSLDVFEHKYIANTRELTIYNISKESTTC